jgi:hypothetical protein
MGTRFGRQAADGTYEYHDSKESLVMSEQRERSEGRAFLFGLIGLVLGGLLTYVVVHALSPAWPKWLSFVVVILGAGGSAYMLAKLADWIWNTILIIAFLGVVYFIGSLIWSAL